MFRAHGRVWTGVHEFGPRRSPSGKLGHWGSLRLAIPLRRQGWTRMRGLWRMRGLRRRGLRRSRRAGGNSMTMRLKGESEFSDEENTKQADSNSAEERIVTSLGCFAFLLLTARSSMVSMGLVFRIKTTRPITIFSNYCNRQIL